MEFLLQAIKTACLVTGKCNQTVRAFVFLFLAFKKDIENLLYRYAQYSDWKMDVQTYILCARVRSLARPIYLRQGSK